MFGLDKLFGQNKEEAPQGPDPAKIQELLENHPAFKVLTVDGLKWIDPHTLQLIDCPFGYVETALEWLLTNTPWHDHACRNPLEVRMKRWWVHLKDNIDFDERYKFFDKNGTWLNPYIGCFEERAQLADGKISRETITTMARSLIDYDEEQLKELKEKHELQILLEERNGQKEQTEKFIKATQRFEVGSEGNSPVPENPPESPALQMAADPDATIATDFNVAPGAEPDPDATIATEFNAQPIMEDTDATIQINYEDKDSVASVDVDKTMDVDFSQGSLLEPPSESKPIKTKKTESFKRVNSDPDIGDQIAGFKIVSFLGKGGMGNVHKAVQMSMQREVALKILPPELCRDETFSTRFIREARAAGKVNHPNVITCYDVGNHNGVLYMALELVTGGDASQLINKSGGKLSPKRAHRILQDCTRGLGAIYKAGLIHRDIKPANIFITDDGISKLADLGLARSSSNQTQMTQAGACVGTPAYMSPEQVKGLDTVDIRTDIYALGITLYTMLVGQNPFKANDVWALFRMIIEEAPPNICDLNADINPAFNDVIQKCLAKEADDRYQTPFELLEALDEL